MALNSSDIQILQEAALALHEPRDLDGLREAAPRIFMQAIPAEHFTWVESDGGAIDLPRGEGTFWESPRRSTPALLRRLHDLLGTHPFTQRVLHHGELGPFRLSDYWTRREQLGSRLHQQFYRHIGIGRLLSIATVRGSIGGSLSLARPLAARDFSERDCEVLRLLVPHFLQALTAAELESARRHAETRLTQAFGLTAREVEVAAWMVRGRTNAEIARILATRPRTIEKHIEKILGKLGAENRTSAARVIFDRAAAGAANGNGQACTPPGLAPPAIIATALGAEAARLAVPGRPRKR